VGAVIRNALPAHAHLSLPAPGCGAVHGKTLPVRAFLPGRALDPDAVLPDAPALIANLFLLTDPVAAQLIETLTPRTTLSRRTLHAHAVGVDAVTLVTDLTIIRAIAIGAILRITPSIGAPETGLAGHIHTGAPPADTVDAHLSLAETPHVATVGGIAETARAQLAFRAGHPHATPLHAFFVDAHLPVPGALLGLTVYGIALPGRTTLAIRAGHFHATGRLALLVDADLPDSRTIPPHTVFRVAIPACAGGPRRAILVQAGDFHAGLVHADEPLGTVAHQAVEGKTIATYDNAVLAFVIVDGAGRAGNQQKGQGGRKRHRTGSAHEFYHRTHLHLEACQPAIRRLPCAPLGKPYPCPF
jgi:hypothetical protein